MKKEMTDTGKEELNEISVFVASRNIYINKISRANEFVSTFICTSDTC